MLIDEFMPGWDVRERHSIVINAPAQTVVAAARRTDLRRARLTRILFALRGITTSENSSLDGLLKMGFVLLGEKRDEEFLLGLTGKFWKPTGDLIRVARDDFIKFNKPGYAKAVWNFSLDKTGDGAVRLKTETRVFCTDAASRLRFRLYWLFIGWFSGLIRREMLGVIKQTAESDFRQQQSGFATSG